MYTIVQKRCLTHMTVVFTIFTMLTDLYNIWHMVY